MHRIIIIPDEGYSRSIYQKAARIYKHLTECNDSSDPIIIVSGATRNPAQQKASKFKFFLEDFLNIIPIKEQLDYLVGQNIPKNCLIHESRSQNTRENAINSLGILKNYDCSMIYLIGSIKGMLRRYLTFQKAKKDMGLRVKIIPCPTWKLFPIKLTVARLFLIPGEFVRIWKYHKLGHL
ncbi:MAG: ElyC/SanA/YdcF family protein [Patescibacteria group bacterium]|nr:ElyC/SanA/YdcF family protein [Patescibacteria group bacterium]